MKTTSLLDFDAKSERASINETLLNSLCESLLALQEGQFGNSSVRPTEAAHV